MSKPLNKKMKLSDSRAQGSEGRMPRAVLRSTDLQAKEAKKKCTSFQTEWLSQVVQTAEKHAKLVKLGDIFSFSSEKGLICKTCCEAKVPGDFSKGKVRDEWKVDYLKRHIKQKSHMNAVGILEGQQVKVLIDNILLAIKMDASLRNVERIHDHTAKYVSLPENWRSQQDAVEFVYNIGDVVHLETMCNIKKAPWHTLIVGLQTTAYRPTDNVLMMYIKYRGENEVSYKTEFCGIVELRARSGLDITRAITEFYSQEGLDLQRMVMLTSNDAVVVLGEHDGAAAALLRQKIPHLTEQHCMIHWKDTHIDATWKDLQLMQEVDGLLKALAVFTKSSGEDLFLDNLEEVLGRVSSRRDFEPQWMACYRAMHALQKNNIEQYCNAIHNDNGDPVAKYCAKMLSEYKVELQALVKVLGELAGLDASLRKPDLAVIEGPRVVKGTEVRLRSEYWKRDMEATAWDDDDDMIKDLDRFSRGVSELMCTHFAAERSEWSAFDICALRFDPAGSEWGSTDVAMLAKKYEAILRPQSVDAIKREYAEFKSIVKPKVIKGTIKSFSDVVAATLSCAELREVSQLVDICGTFQGSVAECDRGFDLMNEIKKASGQFIEVGYLEQLIRIKSRQEAHGAIDLDEVYYHWVSEKTRSAVVSSRQSAVVLL